MVLKLTVDVAALVQVQFLQSCGPLSLADVTYEAKPDIRENEEEDSFAFRKRGGCALGKERQQK